MAPKAEKKPAQPAKKAVTKKSSAGRKKGSKKAVESYKIYIYKVTVRQTLTLCLLSLFASCDCQLLSAIHVQLSELGLWAGAEASPPRHWNFFQGHVNLELVHC
jgi:hypothetical protein